MQLTKFIILIVFVALISCKNDPDLSANQILNLSIEASGGANFYNATLKFRIDELNYTLERDNNITNFEMTRTVDTTVYVGTYNNGALSYYINGRLQEQSTAARKFLQNKLEAVAYLYSIPFVFDHNSIIIERLPNVTLENTEYYSIYVTFKDIGDNPTDKFIIYIDPETFFVDYIAEKFELTGDRLFFRKAFDTKVVKTIKLSSYKVYYSADKDSIPFTKLHEYYSDNKLKEQNEIAPYDLEVILDN